MTRGLKFNKFGLTENPTGYCVCMPWKGRELLGEVRGFLADPMAGLMLLDVYHFNGEPWPVRPTACSVKVLE